MCGFVAVVGSEPTDPEVLDRMRDVLAHRGPDGARSWHATAPGGNVALGHRRLSIIDLTEAADQPMFSRDGRLVLNYNGEIYNYVELRAELQALGHSFRSDGDTEVLLVAYEAWGLECLGRLNGMFAFALWDGRRNQLLVARDRFGEKPLFHAPIGSRGHAFASEMKALFAHPDIDAVPNAEAVSAYARGAIFEDDATTLFAGVERLEPACAMLVGPDGRIERRWRYWTPDYAVRDGFDESSIDRFADLMERSVRMRLRSDVPVGTSLSGGLDSSMIVCLVGGLRDELTIPAQNTFSGRFEDDPTLSEGPYIDLVVRRAGVRPFSTTPSAEQLMHESQLVHWHQEEPFLSASIYLQWCVMRSASEQQTTVLLDGQGADELLGGYQFYFPGHQLDLLERGRLVRLAGESRVFRRRLHHAAHGYTDSGRRFNRDVALGARRLLRAWPTRGRHAASPYPVGVPAPGKGRRMRTQMAEALQYNSLPQLLRYADRNAMAFSREARYPFLDHELVDWCTGLPDSAFIQRGWQKYILRRAGEGLIPPEIQWRADKVGYAAPLDRWLRAELKSWAHDRLFSGPILDVPEYDRVRVLDLWTRHQAGANESWPLWRWISLGEWFQLFEGRWASAPGAARERVEA